METNVISKTFFALLIFLISATAWDNCALSSIPKTVIFQAQYHRAHSKTVLVKRMATVLKTDMLSQNMPTT